MLVTNCHDPELTSTPKTWLSWQRGKIPSLMQCASVVFLTKNELGNQPLSGDKSNDNSGLAQLTTYYTVMLVFY